MNTRFLRLYIYTFRYFEKEIQKIISLKISGFQCGKPTHSAIGYICFAVYFDFVKVIFWLLSEVKVNPQLAHGTHCAIGASLLSKAKTSFHRFYNVSPALLLAMTHCVAHNKKI